MNEEQDKLPENRDQPFVAETKSGFIDGIVKAFDTFVSVFKKNGLATVTFVMTLFLIFYSLILKPIDINQIVMNAIQQEDKARIEMVEKSIHQRFEADKMINQLMNELVEDFGINRAMMFELHNGSQNLSGIEYLFYSATSEVISNKDDQGEIVYDLDYEADSYQKQHVANFVGQIVYDRMRHERYLYFPNLENYHRTSYRFLNKLHQNGANSALVIPFVSNNIPLVLLVCTSKNSEMDAAAIYRYVERYRSSIEKNLMVLGP